MKGKPTTKAEKLYHDQLREMGCIVCLMENKGISPPQIHHCDGKTKDGAHMNILPLCNLHHMGDQLFPPHKDYTSRHPNKAAFEKRYGMEEYLRDQTAYFLRRHLEDIL